MINRINSWRCSLATADQENDVHFNKPLTNDLIFPAVGALSFPQLYISYIEKRNPNTHTQTHTQRHICMLTIVLHKHTGIEPGLQIWGGKAREQGSSRFGLERSPNTLSCVWFRGKRGSKCTKTLLPKSVTGIDFEMSIWPHFAVKTTYSTPLHWNPVCLWPASMQTIF